MVINHGKFYKFYDIVNKYWDAVNAGGESWYDYISELQKNNSIFYIVHSDTLVVLSCSRDVSSLFIGNGMLVEEPYTANSPSITTGESLWAYNEKEGCMYKRYMDYEEQREALANENSNS